MRKDMMHTYSISGMTCSGCATTVKRILEGVEGVATVDVDLSQSTASINMHHHVSLEKLKAALAEFPTYQISTPGPGNGMDHHNGPDPKRKDVSGFWSNPGIWSRASLNTVNCLIGCSIGDFGMILYLQYFHPGVSMTVQMVLAVIAGLATSILMETILLHAREKFAWAAALKTAFSMSFISMIAMELVMNTTDFMITGGKAAFENPMYWGALAVSLVAGFLAPLPYNYYKLRKYNEACH